MPNYSQLLKEAYTHFVLDIGGKHVPIPYRINIPPVEHSAKQGKSSPEVLLNQLRTEATEQKFDLKSASVEEIREFMRQNQLGLDCSGFVYRMLDYLIEEVKEKTLTGFGFPHVGRTNVATLTSDEFSIPIQTVNDIRPGDIIRVNSTQPILHALIVLETINNTIIYAHSSETQLKNGVHKALITIMNPDLPIHEQRWEEDYLLNEFNASLGDGVKRLKVLR